MFKLQAVNRFPHPVGLFALIEVGNPIPHIRTLRLHSLFEVGWIRSGERGGDYRVAGCVSYSILRRQEEGVPTGYHTNEWV